MSTKKDVPMPIVIGAIVVVLIIAVIVFMKIQKPRALANMSYEEVQQKTLGGPAPKRSSGPMTQPPTPGGSPMRGGGPMTGPPVPGGNPLQRR